MSNVGPEQYVFFYDGPSLDLSCTNIIFPVPQKIVANPAWRVRRPTDKASGHPLDSSPPSKNALSLSLSAVRTYPTATAREHPP